MTLNVAVIGTGIFATDAHLPSFQRLTDTYRLVGCYNRTESKAQAFAEKAGIKKVYKSLEEVFQDPDVQVVDALLPVQVNVEIVKLAIKHKKPLTIEKPIAANMDQAREIVKLSKGSETPIMILEQWSYYKAIPKIKELLPQIGNVQSFAYSSTGSFNFTNKYLGTSWRLTPQHIGGYLSDGGVHQLALLTGVLGHVSTVSAHTRQVRQQSGTDDILYSLFKCESGVIGTFNYGSAFGNTDKTCYLQILGDNGSILYDFSPAKTPTIELKTGGATAETPKSSEVIEIENENLGTFKELEVFGESIKSGNHDAILTPPSVAFHHLAIIDAALKSAAKSGDSVTVEVV